MGIVADLHMHTVFSDGLNTTEEICELVANKGLKAFSVTDHDSVKGIASLKKFATVTFIPGIELTATTNRKEVHILGYYINPETEQLLETLHKIQEKRVERLMEMVDRLNKLGKFLIDRDELMEEMGDGLYNRLNLARFMIKKKMAPRIDYCFSQYFGDGSELYEPVDYFSPHKAIGLIHKSGGLAFLAHPYNLDIQAMIPEFVEQGLDGLEAFYPTHKPNEVRQCLEWAERFGLGVSGGSDFHGTLGSTKQIMAAGLDGERLVDFLAIKPDCDFVTA